MLRGAPEIVDHIKQATGVAEAKAVSKDGLFSYEEVECLGACEYAPMLRLDHEYQYDLTPAKVDALVAERRNPSGGSAIPSPLMGEGQGEGLKKPSPPRKPRAPRKKKADA